MRRFFKVSFVVLLLPVLVSLSGCGGGGGASVTETTPAADSPATAASPPATEPQMTGVVTLAWDPPTDETGSALPVVAGYRLRYGTSAGTYATTVDIGTATSCTVSELAPGTYYFTVTAYDSSGNESDYSNETTWQIP